MADEKKSKKAPALAPPQDSKTGGIDAVQQLHVGEDVRPPSKSEEKSIVKPIRDERGRLLKGSSLNPGGRPQGVAARARALAGGDGFEILELWREIYRNSREKTADRLLASKLYSERMWGKALEIIANADLGGDGRDQLAEITSEVLLDFLQQAKAGKEKALPKMEDAQLLPEPKDPKPEGT